MPIGSVFEEDGIARNAWVLSVLDRVGLTGDLVEVGAQLARIIVELLGGLRAEREFFSDATTVLDREMEAAIFQRLKDEFVGRSLFVSLHRTRLASHFDRILIMEQSCLVEQGDFAKLQKPGSAPAPLRRRRSAPCWPCPRLLTVDDRDHSA